MEEALKLVEFINQQINKCPEEWESAYEEEKLKRTDRVEVIERRFEIKRSEKKLAWFLSDELFKDPRRFENIVYRLKRFEARLLTELRENKYFNAPMFEEEVLRKIRSELGLSKEEALYKLLELKERFQEEGWIEVKEW